MSSDAVKKWRRETKLRVIAAMGGKCAICGYDCCPEALEFHHLEPAHKDFSLSSTRANPKSWAKIVDELRKCILLCANHHREVHAGVTDITEEFACFDESFLAYRAPLKAPCPVCGTETVLGSKKTCSVQCASAARARKWDGFDLDELIKTMTNGQIAQMVGVSETAVRKRLARMQRAEE